MQANLQSNFNDKPFSNINVGNFVNDIKQGSSQIRDIISSMEQKIQDLRTDNEKLRTSNASLKKYDDLTSNVSSELNFILVKLSKYDECIELFNFKKDNFQKQTEESQKEILQFKDTITNLTLVNTNLKTEKDILQKDQNKFKIALDNLEKKFSSDMKLKGDMLKELIEKSLFTTNFDRIRQLENQILEERNLRMEAEQKLNARESELKLAHMEYQVLLKVNEDVRKVDSERFAKTHQNIRTIDQNQSQISFQCLENTDNSDFCDKYRHNYNKKPNNNEKKSYNQSNTYNQQNFKEKKNLNQKPLNKKSARTNNSMMEEEQQYIEMNNNSILYDLEHMKF